LSSRDIFSTVPNLSIEIPESNCQRSLFPNFLQATKKPNLAPNIKADTPISSTLVFNVRDKTEFEVPEVFKNHSRFRGIPVSCGGINLAAWMLQSTKKFKFFSAPVSAPFGPHYYPCFSSGGGENSKPPPHGNFFF
jgi:hypothetical protein